ncbi:hypothetical protein LEM8419_03512 [Neolewinella maritima]|uniref:Uncharacterized protein n=2 Tax=Neolewinella maritima TaxID=1383882 RepID=A0ABN8FF56_9BACT|nr:hypothetical protein LEM8419_03512 [Neolewinella maritima]
MDEKCQEIDKRTSQLKRMAQLARAGKKETEEYKNIEWESKQPAVFDFGDKMEDLRKIVKRLRKYSFS